MRKFLRESGAIAALALLICAAGCTNQPTNVADNNSNITATTTPTITPTPQALSAADANAMPVTLPLLDAFFADESFKPDLKTKLQLTDEQVNKLQTMAREETSKLRESDKEETAGSTTAAREHASQQISVIIGEEKSQQLAAFLRERWNGPAETDTTNAATTTTDANNTGASNLAAHTAHGKFNAVPTDTRIVVNAPAYRMDVYESGKLIKTYKVGIGYPEFPLPTGLRRANSIIFNPSWTPPDEPWVEGSSKIKPGQKIEAGSKLNPLGPIKIPIGLPSLIHGGKSPAKLGTFASHGCVGLTTPQIQDFTRVLARVSGTEISDEQYQEFTKNPKDTKDIKLSRAVPVELRYETIVVEDGKLHIYRDVYERNTNTEENLRAVLATYNVTLEQLSEQERTQVLSALKDMSRDASGNSNTGAANSNANTNANSNASSGAAAQSNSSNKNANSNSGNAASKNERNKNDSGGQVTRAVKGKKEIVIQIAALQGKGYPAPVELNTGGGPSKQSATLPKNKRQ